MFWYIAIGLSAWIATLVAIGTWMRGATSLPTPTPELTTDEIAEQEAVVTDILDMFDAARQAGARVAIALDEESTITTGDVAILAAFALGRTVEDDRVRAYNFDGLAVREYQEGV